MFYDYTGLGLTAQNPGNSGASQTTYFTRDDKGTLVSMRAPDQTYYYIFDGLGSVVAMTDQNGTVVANYTYDPYGDTSSSGTAAASNPWRYASGYWDKDVSLYKFGTRYYNPTWTRWTQPDPAGGSIARPKSFNRYLYAGCNPTNNTDPSGYMLISEGGGDSSAGADGWAGATVGRAYASYVQVTSDLASSDFSLSGEAARNLSCGTGIAVAIKGTFDLVTALGILGGAAASPIPGDEIPAAYLATNRAALGVADISAGAAVGFDYCL